MPALNFQKQFAQDVEIGKKRQTIRAYRKDGRDPKTGDTLYLYTGMRTNQCRILGTAPCARTVHVEIGHIDTIRLDGDFIGDHAALLLAQADGFKTTQEMFKWFNKTHGLPFTGLLIQWDLQPAHIVRILNDWQCGVKHPEIMRKYAITREQEYAITECGVSLNVDEICERLKNVKPGMKGRAVRMIMVS